MAASAGLIPFSRVPLGLRKPCPYLCSASALLVDQPLWAHPRKCSETSIATMRRRSVKNKRMAHPCPVSPVSGEGR